MRGRKRNSAVKVIVVDNWAIKKESPNEGTETDMSVEEIREATKAIKKESPNEGTETSFIYVNSDQSVCYKKRIPE